VIGYCFVKWSSFDLKTGDNEAVKLNQASLKFMLAEDVPEKGPLISRLPLNADGGRDADIYSTNAKLAKTLMDKYKVTVQHEVLVKTVGGTVKKTVERTFMFFDIACRLLLTFSFGSKQEDILRLPYSTFRSVSVFAYVLYMMTKEFIDRWNKDGVNALAKLNEISFGSLCLKSLMPGDYRVKEMLSTGNCLIVSQGDVLF